MPEFLNNSAAIRQKLNALFTRKTRGRRRVVLVGYVGADAPALLPDFSAVELYCWPQVGSTNPSALAALSSSRYGATVRLCDGLHMKLYWVDGVGCVVASANLSNSALGEHSLHECGVFLEESAAVDIDAIVDRLDSRPLTTTELAQLQREHDLYWSQPNGKQQAARVKPPSFIEWYDERAVRPWKLGWWDSHGDESDSSAEKGRIEFGVQQIEDFMHCNEGDYERGDWVLTYKITPNKTATEIDWLFVQAVNTLTPDEQIEADGYSHEAIQATPLGRYLVPPFALTKDFRQSFKAACQSYGVGRLQKQRSTTPTNTFLKQLREAMLEV